MDGIAVLATLFLGVCLVFMRNNTKISIQRMEQHFRILDERLTSLEQSQVAVADAPSPQVATAPTPVPAPVPAAMPAPVPAAMPAPVAASTSAVPSPPPIPAPGQKAAPAGPSFTDRLAEHALSLAGGALVLAGVLFFVTYAVNRGWIGEELRTLLVLCGGAVLAGLGIRLGERLRSEGESFDIALGSVHGVLVGTGFTIMFIGAVVATRLYDILDPTLGVVLALAIGTSATAQAYRWHSQDLAGIGVVGALASPLLVGASADNVTLALLAAAFLGSAWLVMTMGWSWLVGLTILVTAPQILDWTSSTAKLPDSLAIVIPVGAVLLAWWGVLIASSVRLAIAQPARKLWGAASGAVFAASGTVAVGLAIATNDPVGGEELLPWLFMGFGALHAILGGIALERWKSPAIAAYFLPLGGALIAIGLTDQTGGVALVALWSAEVVTLTYAAVRSGSLRTAVLAGALGVMAIGHAFMYEVPPSELLDPGSVWQFILTSASVLGAFAACRMIVQPHGRGVTVRRVLEALGGVAALYCASIVVALSFAVGERLAVESTYFYPFAQYNMASLWLVGACAAAWIYWRTKRWEWQLLAGLLCTLAPLWLLALDIGADWGTQVMLVSTGVALGFVTRTAQSIGARLVAVATAAMATVHLLTVDAPLFEAVFGGVDNLFRAVISGTLVTGLLISLVVFSRSAEGFAPVRRVMSIGAAFTALLIPTVVLTTTVSSSSEEAAQAALSIMWGLIGVGALLASFHPRLRAISDIRRVGLGLFALASTKVVLVDTAQLEAIFRVLAFVGLGLVLLGGAYVDQRLRAAMDADQE